VWIKQTETDTDATGPVAVWRRDSDGTVIEVGQGVDPNRPMIAAAIDRQLAEITERFGGHVST
jgi:hypothetical protein